MICDIEIFVDGRWQLLAHFKPFTQGQVERLGYRCPGTFDYDVEYAAEHVDSKDLHAASCQYPVDFTIHNLTTWPAFLLDILPSGAGRRAILNLLQLPDRGPRSDWELLMKGASNPPGNLRIRQAVEPQTQSHPGFTQADIVSRHEAFLEYALQRGAPVAGSSGAQGDAPKFLLTQDHEQKWHADGTLPDEKALKHWLVKMPRGHLNSDYTILKNEAAYYAIAQALSLRVHALPTLIEHTLFIERFDRKVHNKKVTRIGLESLCSLAGISDFGVHLPQLQLCHAFMPHVSEPKTELIEFIKRDILNVALGNTDNHPRNTTVCKYPNGKIALSPIYDFAPMILDEQGIVRCCRWGELDNSGNPAWRDILKLLADEFSDYNIEFNELCKEINLFREELLQLDHLFSKTNVDEALVARLENPIKYTYKALEDCKP